MKATGFFVAISASTNLGRNPLRAAVPRPGATEANAAITNRRADEPRAMRVSISASLSDDAARRGAAGGARAGGAGAGAAPAGGGGRAAGGGGGGRPAARGG